MKRRKKLLEEKKIAVLSSEIEEYEKNISTHQYEIIENDLRSNIICQRFVYLSYHIAKEQPTISEWNNLKELIENKIPNFRAKIFCNLQLTDAEYRICLLVRLKFKAAEIADLTNLSRTSITLIRKRLLRKIFGMEGQAKDFDKEINKIY